VTSSRESGINSVFTGSLLYEGANRKVKERQETVGTRRNNEYFKLVDLLLRKSGLGTGVALFMWSWVLVVARVTNLVETSRPSFFAKYSRICLYVRPNL
jgi:hypothetical protein